MLNDARVASACLYVRTCQRVRNSKNTATIRDFQVHVRVNSTTELVTMKVVLYVLRDRSPTRTRGPEAKEKFANFFSGLHP